MPSDGTNASVEGVWPDAGRLANEKALSQPPTNSTAPATAFGAFPNTGRTLSRFADANKHRDPSAGPLGNRRGAAEPLGQ